MMRNLLPIVLFVAGLLSVSFGAACDEEVKKLGATVCELGMILIPSQWNKTNYKNGELKMSESVFLLVTLALILYFCHTLLHCVEDIVI